MLDLARCQDLVVILLGLVAVLVLAAIINLISQLLGK